MWRPSPQAPGPAMEASGHFHTSCASLLPIGPLADWQIIPRPPFNPLQLAPAAMMVCTPCYGNISHSHSQSHSDFPSLSLTHSHTHPYSRSSSHPYPIRTPPHPLASICLLRPFQFASCRPKAAPKPLFNTELLHGPSHAHALTNIFFARYYVYTQSMCIMQTRFRLPCPVHHIQHNPPSWYLAYQAVST